MFRTAAIFVFLAFLKANPGTAAAETIRIPIPELLGEYSVDNNTLGYGSLPARHVSVATGVSHFGAETATIELKGTIAHGTVRGDGVLRPNSQTILDGAFGTSFSAASHTIGSIDYRFELSPAGEFEQNWTYSIPFQPGIDDFPCINCEPRTFTPTVAVSFTPSWGRLENELPFLTPTAEGEFRLVGDGLVAFVPAVGTITEAYLVIEHRFIPEPSTLAFAAAGISLATLGLLRRRHRRPRATELPN